MVMRPRCGICPAHICFDPVTLTVMAVAAGVGQVMQGREANLAAKAQAGMQEEQARIALAESERAAEQKTVEQRKFLAEQRMAYLASGVSMSGTPGIVGADTSREFQMEIDALRKSGAAQFGLGMRQAAITKRTGRAQLVSGILSGIGTAASGASKAGMFSKTPGTTASSTVPSAGGSYGPSYSNATWDMIHA